MQTDANAAYCGKAVCWTGGLCISRAGWSERASAGWRAGSRPSIREHHCNPSTPQRASWQQRGLARVAASSGSHVPH